MVFGHAMAQAQLLPMPSIAMAGSLSAQELHEIQECERLIRFRDEVLSGNHTRIKPPHLASKPTSNDSRSPSSALMSSVAPTTKSQAGAVGNRQMAVDTEHSGQPSISQPSLPSYSVNNFQAVPGLDSLPDSGKAAASSSKPFIPSGSTEINPVLLEKSAGLVKAEMQFKRQRLERALRDEMDQRRVSAKASLQAPESLPDFDLADVLAKAQTLVQPTSVQPTDDTAANASASSDSFDDNTFYSSQHDTPEFLEEEPRDQNRSPDDVGMRDESPYEPELEDPPAAPVVPSQSVVSKTPKQSDANALVSNNPTPINIPTGPRADRVNGLGARQNIPPIIPGLQTAQNIGGAVSQDAGAEASRSEESSNIGKQATIDQHRLNEVNNGLLRHSPGGQPSPLIRAYDLSPIAPQPAHISPLAVARQAAAAPVDDTGRRATPAQIAALRKQPSAASSPDGSPRDSGATEKKREKKKKKRRSERLAAADSAGATTASPYIKHEPRSPSPLAAPAYARPNKRVRQEQRQPAAVNYDLARYDHPSRAQDGYAEGYEPRRAYVEEGYPPSQAPQFEEDLHPRQAQPSVVGSDSRYERDYYEPRRPLSPTQYARPASPGNAFPAHYVPGQARAVRAVSHAVLERPYRDARDSRMSVRPVVDRDRSRSPVAYEGHAPVMPPPRAPVRRIIVDEYGREYIEPPRPATVVRAPMAPPSAGLDEPEVIYERPVPARAVSRRPDVYDDGLVYRQPSPSYGPGYAPYSRRVVTQPELAGPDYRAYRERDYVPRPVLRPADEFPPPGGAAEAPREYVTRAASVHPAGEAYRYDAATGFQRRIVEEVPRESAPVRAASVRPVDPRYEARRGYERRVVDIGEYGAVPARTVSVRPADSMPYEVAREQAWRMGSARPDREYAASVMPEAPREVMHPAGRAYGVRPLETASPAAIRHEYQQPVPRPAGGYYERVPGIGEEEVTYVDHGPRQGAYHGEPLRR